MNRVILSPEYFPNPTIGRPVSGGQIYVGVVDTDPEIPANQIQLSVQQEDGSIVAVAQPVLTGAGGVPLYNGSPVSLLADGDYSLKLLDNLGGQLYYVPAVTRLSVTQFTEEDMLGLIGRIPVEGDEVSVFGFFYAPELNPKGGGRFVWRGGLSKNLANGGTIIDPSNTGGFDGTVTTLVPFLNSQGTGVGVGCWTRISVDHHSIQWFGAVGDGVTDCTTSIQKAINSLPLNTDDTGILTPKGFANGGTVFIPKGRYKVTSKVVLQRGLRITGESRESSQVASFVNDDSTFQYRDEGRYLQDELVFENMSIWQDSSVVSTAGAAIDILTGPTAVQSLYLRVANVIIEGTYFGIRAEALVASSISDSNISKCILDGVSIVFDGGVSSTSLVVSSTYSHINGRHGFSVKQGAYISFVSSAGDSNASDGYHIEGTQVVSFVATGAEANARTGISLSGTSGVDINAFMTANTLGGLEVAGTNGAVTLSGGSLNGAVGTAILNLTNSGRIVAIGTTFLGSYVTSKYQTPQRYLELAGDGGLVGGDSNRWAVGVAAQPDATSVFNIGGTSDLEVDTALKTNASFTKAGSTRNSAAFIQAITDNSAVTYPLLNGVFIPAHSVGAASTVSRAAGLYVVEQNSGVTANADIMIDAGAGTVPAGSWSIYNQSLKPSMFKGPIQFTPLSSSTAPINSLFVDSADGNLKFKNSASVIFSLTP